MPSATRSKITRVKGSKQRSLDPRQKSSAARASVTETKIKFLKNRNEREMQLASGENETIPAQRKVRILLGKVRDGRGASSVSPSRRSHK